MKALSVALIVTCGCLSTIHASQNLDRARQLEESGDAMGARAVLARAAQDAPGDATALQEYAEFLDRYGDPAGRDVYGKLLAALGKSSDSRARAAAARRLAELFLLSGARDAAMKYLEVCRQAGKQGDEQRRDGGQCGRSQPAARSAAPASSRILSEKAS